MSLGRSHGRPQSVAIYMDWPVVIIKRKYASSSLNLAVAKPLGVQRPKRIGHLRVGFPNGLLAPRGTRSHSIEGRPHRHRHALASSLGPNLSRTSPIKRFLSGISHELSRTRHTNTRLNSRHTQTHVGLEFESMRTFSPGGGGG